MVAMIVASCIGLGKTSRSEIQNLVNICRIFNKLYSIVIMVHVLTQNSLDIEYR